MIERAMLPPPAGSAAYELTPLGEDLEPVVRAISRWGSRFVAREPRQDESIAPNAYMLALRSTFRSEEAAGLRTFSRLLWHRIVTSKALARGSVLIRGNPADLELFVRVFAHRLPASV